MANYPPLPNIPESLDADARDFFNILLEIIEMMLTTRGGENSKVVTKQMLENSGMDVSVLEEGEPTIVYTYN